MTDEQRDQSECEAEEGQAADAGRAIDPLLLPEEDGEEAAPSRPRAAPIGRPVSAEEYQRMKEEAARGPAPRARNAQEDPAG